MIRRYYVGEAFPATVGPFLTSLGIEGATLWLSWGLWNGAVEDCTVVEIVGPAPRDLAERLREEYGQEAVLQVEIPAQWRIYDRTTR